MRSPNSGCHPISDFTSQTFPAAAAEMVAALRTDCLADFRTKHLSTPGIPSAVHKLLKHLEFLIALAA